MPPLRDRPDDVPLRVLRNRTAALDVNKQIWQREVPDAGAGEGRTLSSAEMVDCLRYSAPGFVYSVGLSPADTAAALTALPATAAIAAAFPILLLTRAGRRFASSTRSTCSWRRLSLSPSALARRSTSSAKEKNASASSRSSATSTPR